VIICPFYVELHVSHSWGGRGEGRLAPIPLVGDPDIKPNSRPTQKIIFCHKWTPFAPPGHPKITQISKSALHNRTFYPSEKSLEICSFRVLPEPSKLNCLFNNTLILTCGPCPPNGHKMSFQIPKCPKMVHQKIQ